MVSFGTAAVLLASRNGLASDLDPLQPILDAMELNLYVRCPLTGLLIETFKRVVHGCGALIDVSDGDDGSSPDRTTAQTR